MWVFPHLPPRDVLIEALGRIDWRWPVGQCFVNAQRLALADDRITYVEGYVGTLDGAHPQALYPHAWNRIGEHVVDMSLRDGPGGKERIAGRIPPSLVYVEMVTPRVEAVTGQPLALHAIGGQGYGPKA